MNVKSINPYWWLIVGLGAAVGYYYYGRSASQSAGAWDESSGDSSNPSAGADDSTVAGVVTGWANTIGYTLGISSPLGLRLHNPFNIRYSSANNWVGQVGNSGGFCEFDTDEHGCRAGGHLLRSYASQGVVTVNGIISKFAPPSENNTAAYIADVLSKLGLSEWDGDTPIDVYTLLPQLGDAIIHHEQGVQPFSMAQLNQWMYEA